MATSVALHGHAGWDPPTSALTVSVVVTAGRSLDRIGREEVRGTVERHVAVRPAATEAYSQAPVVRELPEEGPRRSEHPDVSGGRRGGAGNGQGRENAPASRQVATRSTGMTADVRLPAEYSEAPRTWDELASKLERRFLTLLKRLDAMRADLEGAAQRARHFEDTLPREAAWNGQRAGS